MRVVLLVFALCIIVGPRRIWLSASRSISTVVERLCANLTWSFAIIKVAGPQLFVECGGRARHRPKVELCVPLADIIMSGRDCAWSMRSSLMTEVPVTAVRQTQLATTMVRLQAMTEIPLFLQESHLSYRTSASRRARANERTHATVVDRFGMVAYGMVTLLMSLGGSGICRRVGMRFGTTA